eukprot:gene9645-biopygen1302
MVRVLLSWPVRIKVARVARTHAQTHWQNSVRVSVRVCAGVTLSV